MTNENAMFCYRPDNTCYAILSTYEWEKLRKAGTLDAELKRRRDSGVVLEVVRPDTKLPVKHFKPRGDDTRVVAAPTPAMTHELAYARGVADRSASLPMIDHGDIPDGEMWDSYVDGYEARNTAPPNPCEVRDEVVAAAQEPSDLDGR